jgi:hypothetical protein
MNTMLKMQDMTERLQTLQWKSVTIKRMVDRSQ